MQDMVSFILPSSNRIRVFYIEWLSDSLESNKIMAVQPYLAI